VAEQIHQSAYRAQLEVERGERIVVGVNQYRVDEPPPPLFSVDPALEAAQRERLGRVRARRAGPRVVAALSGLDAAARAETNLLPPIVEAVRAEATVGEISDTLRRVFGTFDHS
jgi:methylmalonyl-CoA mutase N-terminal domain/subunit